MVIKPPQKYKFEHGKCAVFLGGSIEMGTAEDWQVEITDLITKNCTDYQILNPRRDDWDPTWKQSKDNPQFREQVEWELDGLENSDVQIFYFASGTKSPITLLELGLFASGKSTIVYCPEAFWRKGNIDIVCERYNIKCFDDKEEFKKATVKLINETTSRIKSLY